MKTITNTLKSTITISATAAILKPKIHIEQSEHQTITVTYNGKNYTSDFLVAPGDSITCVVTPTDNVNYLEGMLIVGGTNTHIQKYTATITKDTTISATAVQTLRYTWTVGIGEYTYDSWLFRGFRSWEFQGNGGIVAGFISPEDRLDQVAITTNGITSYYGLSICGRQYFFDEYVMYSVALFFKDGVRVVQQNMYSIKEKTGDFFTNTPNIEQMKFGYDEMGKYMNDTCILRMYR